MTTSKDETKKPASQEDAKPRVWDWTPKFSVPIPANTAPATTRSTALPFLENFFKPTVVDALGGKQPFLFVPLAFFQERSDAYAKSAGKATKTVTHGDARAKLNGQFKDFQKSTPAASSLALTLVNYTGKEGAEGISEPGVGMWVILKK